MTTAAAAMISPTALSTAISALIQHLQSSPASTKSQLLSPSDDDFLYLVLTLRNIPSTARLNPHLLPLPHPLFTLADNPSLCLFIDDRRPSPPNLSSFPFADVITLSSLRSDYRPFESRRRLLSSHDLFFADRSIIPLLPRLIGKEFFKKKKIPFAVDMSRPGWVEQVGRCLASSRLFIRSGSCCVVRIGRVSMKVEDVVENALAVLEKGIEFVPKKWANLRSVLVKAVDSVALPVYQAVPEMGMKIDIGQKRKSDVLVDENLVVKKVTVEGDVLLKKSKKLKGRIHDLLGAQESKLKNNDEDGAVSEDVDVNDKAGSVDEDEKTNEKLDNSNKKRKKDGLKKKVVGKKEKLGIKAKRGEVENDDEDGAVIEDVDGHDKTGSAGSVDEDEKTNEELDISNKKRKKDGHKKKVAGKKGKLGIKAKKGEVENNDDGLVSENFNDQDKAGSVEDEKTDEISDSSNKKRKKDGNKKIAGKKEKPGLKVKKGDGFSDVEKLNKIENGDQLQDNKDGKTRKKKKKVGQLGSQEVF